MCVGAAPSLQLGLSLADLAIAERVSDIAEHARFTGRMHRVALSGRQRDARPASCPRVGRPIRKRHTVRIDNLPAAREAAFGRKGLADALDHLFDAHPLEQSNLAASGIGFQNLICVKRINEPVVGHELGG
jgi:hypothetical protein